MNETKRNHPIAILYNLWDIIKRNFFTVIILVIANPGKNENWFDHIYNWGIFAIIILTALGGILSWFRYTYRLEDDYIYIKEGAFVRKERQISYQRIQGIHTAQSFLHKPFGLTKLSMETAGGTKPEVEINAITEKDLQEIRRVIQLKRSPGKAPSQNQQTAGEAPDGFTTLYRSNGLLDVLYAVTSGGVVATFLALTGFITQFNELLPGEFWDRLYKGFLSFGPVTDTVLVILLLLVLWFGAGLFTLIKNGRFSLSANSTHLRVTKGYFEVHEQDIKLSKIQAVYFKENWLRQLLGLSSLYFCSAGRSGDLKEMKATGAGNLLCPLIQKKSLEPLLAQALPSYTLPRKREKRGVATSRLFAIKGLVIVGTAGAAAAYFLPWGWLAFLLIPVIWLYGRQISRDACVHFDDRKLCLTYRLFSKTTVLAKKSDIQAIKIEQTYSQKLFASNYRNLSFNVIDAMPGQSFTLRNTQSDELDPVMDWFSPNYKAAE